LWRVCQVSADDPAVYGERDPRVRHVYRGPREGIRRHRDHAGDQGHPVLPGREECRRRNRGQVSPSLLKISSVVK
jgi:hypothetical protein